MTVTTCSHETRFKRWLSPETIGWYCDVCYEFLCSRQRCHGVTRARRRCLAGVPPEYPACAVHNPDPNNPWRKAVNSPDWEMKRAAGLARWRRDRRQQSQ